MPFEIVPLISEGMQRDQIVGRDFIHFWGAAKLLVEGRASEIYDGENFPVAVAAFFEQNVLVHEFAYPPHLIVFLYPFGLLPYEMSYVLWSSLSLLLFIFAVAAPDFRKEQVFLALIAPTTVLTINYGQTALFTAALFVAGMRLLLVRPILAGVLIGVLTIKPNLGLLIPIALLACGAWRPFFAAAITALLLVILSSVVLGWETWTSAYPANSQARVSEILDSVTGIFRYMMLTPFMSLRLIGVGQEIAYAVQGLCFLLGAGFVIVVFRGTGSQELKIASLATATFLASPYIHHYDMAMLLGTAVLLSSDYEVNRQKTIYLLMLCLIWGLPFIGFTLAAAKVPIAPLLVLVLALILLRVMRNGEGRSYGQNSMQTCKPQNIQDVET